MPRGRTGWTIRPGLFIKEYLESHDEAYISEIHRAYKAAWAEVNSLRDKKTHIHTATYENFRKYFDHLIKLGLVEFSREEAMEFVPAGGELLSIREGEVVPSTRRYYRLTDKGREEEDMWFNPPYYRRAVTG